MHGARRDTAWASSAAIELLPPEVPAFLRTPAARANVGEMANEPDTSRMSGKTHDPSAMQAISSDLTDDGKAMGIVALSAFARTRAEYDALLNAGGSDQYKAGYIALRDHRRLSAGREGSGLLACACVSARKRQ